MKKKLLQSIGYFFFIYVCKCIHKNRIISVTIVICSMPKAQSKRVTAKANIRLMIHQHPGPNAHRSHRHGMRMMVIAPGMSQASARHWQYSMRPCLSSKDSFSTPCLESEQPTASCSTAAKTLMNQASP